MPTDKAEQRLSETESVEGLAESKKKEESDIAYRDYPKYYGYKMTAGVFQQHLEDGNIDDDDGRGYWATNSRVSSVDCFDDRPDWATHVFWCGK